MIHFLHKIYGRTDSDRRTDRRPNISNYRVASLLKNTFFSLLSIENIIFLFLTFQYFSYKQFTAAQWWTLKLKQFEREEDLDGAKFARFMIGLHSCVASSAGIERWFSTIGFVWSKVRNRLGFKKAEKLAAVYRGLRSCKKPSIEIVPGSTAVTESQSAASSGEQDDNEVEDPVDIFNDSYHEDDDLTSGSILLSDDDLDVVNA